MILPASLLIGSVSLDLVACYCVKRSKGFKKAIWGVAGLLSIILAFVLLSFVVRYIPLGIAYSVWGGLGVLGTVLLDRLLFNSVVALCSSYHLLKRQALAAFFVPEHFSSARALF